MAKKKKENKVDLFSYDPVETPEDIIKGDKDLERKKAFLDTYQRIAKIIPEYFMSQKKKKNNTSSNAGGTAFSQSIVVTPDKATVQTQEVKNENVEQKEEKERE